MRARSALAMLFLAGFVNANADETTPYQTAKQQGIRTCLSELRGVSNFIIDDHEHGSHDVWTSDATDSRMFSSFIVKGYSDGDSHVTIVVGPDKSGRCYVEYNETAFWPQSCTVIREAVFSELKYVDSLKETSVVLESKNGSVNVYLTPQNNGGACLSTKREVIYSAD
jgi:hypothetical protein